MCSQVDHHFRQFGKPGLSEERCKIVYLRKRIIRTSSHSPLVPNRVHSHIGCTCLRVGTHTGVAQGGQKARCLAQSGRCPPASCPEPCAAAVTAVRMSQGNGR